MSYPNLPPTLTPQKPLPGAYFQTPAPSHAPNAPLFSPTPATPAQAAAPAVDQPSSAALPKLPPAASKSKNQTLSTEERGAGTINDTLAQESRYPDLDSYLSREFVSIQGACCVLDLTDNWRGRGSLVRL